MRPQHLLHLHQTYSGKILATICLYSLGKKSLMKKLKYKHFWIIIILFYHSWYKYRYSCTFEVSYSTVQSWKWTLLQFYGFRKNLWWRNLKIKLCLSPLNYGTNLLYYVVSKCNLTLVTAVLLLAENSVATLPFDNPPAWSEDVTPVSCRMNVTSCPATLSFNVSHKRQTEDGNAQ